MKKKREDISVAQGSRKKGAAKSSQKEGRGCKKGEKKSHRGNLGVSEEKKKNKTRQTPNKDSISTKDELRKSRGK